MRINKVFIAFSILFFTFAGHYSSNCQGGVDATGTGGLHTIQGRIYLPNGRTPDYSITVKLESYDSGGRSITSDRNGGFSFRNLAPGNYTVVVDAGENYLVAKEYFLIEPEVQGQNVRVQPIPKVFTVPVYLQFKPNSPLKNEVVNARFASIPKGALEQCQKGLELIRSGKTDEATKAFRDSIAIYPQFSVPHTELGKILLKAGRTEESISELSLALKFDPKDFDAKLNYGIALMSKREPVSAEKELRAAAEIDRSAVTPHYYLGVLYMQTNDLAGAQKEMETAKSLKGEKDFPLVHKYLGGIYWGQKQYKLAAEELEKYIQLAPNAKDADQTRKAIQDLKKQAN
jgi:Tfp pilus assembly protein PilF